MKNLGTMLIIVGVICLGLGVLVTYGGLPLGRLPGDIRIVKPGMNFYFPLTTCILLSLVVSLVIALLRLFR